MLIWSWLTQSKYPVPFTHKGVYLNSPDLSLFTCGIDLFIVLGVFYFPPLYIYSYNRKMKQNCIFPLAWANWEYYSPPLQNVSCPQANDKVSVVTVFLLHW